MDTFRREYTPLDEEQKEQVVKIKNKAQELLDLFNEVSAIDERTEKARCMAIARTNLETTVMWAVKSATTKKQ